MRAEAVTVTDVSSGDLRRIAEGFLRAPEHGRISESIEALTAILHTVHRWGAAAANGATADDLGALSNSEAVKRAPAEVQAALLVLGKALLERMKAAR